MTSEVVKYAPEAVIDELDNALPTLNPYTVLDTFLVGPQSSETKDWYESQQKKFSHADIQLAIINHVFNNERLQPELRYFVKFKDFDGDTAIVAKGALTSVHVYFKTTHDDIGYSNGIDHETAEKAQDLYGGTIEEIK